MESSNSYQGGTTSYKRRGNYYPRCGFNGKCFRCGEEGHRSFKYKKFGESVGRNVVIQGEFEQPQCDPDDGENLMMSRTLCNKKVDKEPSLRRSIFKTRCKRSKKMFQGDH